MNKKTINKHIIEISAEEAKNRIVESFLDIIKDYASEDIDDLKVQTSILDECVNDIRDNNWRKLFNEGYTMMILDREVFDFVEDFFIKKNKYQYSAELEIVIKTENGDAFIVPEKYIQY
jgi:hypothetical protein